MARAYENPSNPSADVDAATLPLRGGRLCLDFANTVDWHAGARHGQEYLTSYAELIAWGRHAGILAGDEAHTLMREAAHHAERAQAALDQAIALREVVYRVFSVLAHGRPTDAGDLAALNAVLVEAHAHLRLRAGTPHFSWAWEPDGPALDRILWPVARSAAELLTADELERVRECASDSCGWLFLDTSKNRSRRWCDMAGCGNRAKARRHYARGRRSTGPDT
ncbi:MAG TPA: ABATE domain-containing protein [Ktedonobacterales bacterium]|jgi:predicted RNA-binding Zn ribbon-like protein|nr:ABATE domain-containing protein [Ktedonobacterales bacterium]